MKGGIVNSMQFVYHASGHVNTCIYAACSVHPYILLYSHDCLQNTKVHKQNTVDTIYDLEVNTMVEYYSTMHIWLHI